MHARQRLLTFLKRWVFLGFVLVTLLYLLPRCRQAESELSDKAQREELDAIINQARTLVLKSLNLPTTTAVTDSKLHGLEPPFKVRLRAQSKLLMIDEEVRRRK